MRQQLSRPMRVKHALVFIAILLISNGVSGFMSYRLGKRVQQGLTAGWVLNFYTAVYQRVDEPKAVKESLEVAMTGSLNTLQRVRWEAFWMRPFLHDLYHDNHFVESLDFAKKVVAASPWQTVVAPEMRLDKEAPHGGRQP